MPQQLTGRIQLLNQGTPWGAFCYQHAKKSKIKSASCSIVQGTSKDGVADMPAGQPLLPAAS